MSQFPYTQYVQATQAYQSSLPPRSVPPRFTSSVGAPSAAGAVSSKSTVACAYSQLWLRPGAPLSVVKAAYRSLAAQYHPDAGGDPHAMRRLNEAYETLCKHLA